MALLARLCWKKSVRPRRALNPRPPDYMSGALPSELPGPTSLFQPSPVQVTVVSTMSVTTPNKHRISMSSSSFFFVCTSKCQEINSFIQISSIYLWTITGLHDASNSAISRYVISQARNHKFCPGDPPFMKMPAIIVKFTCARKLDRPDCYLRQDNKFETGWFTVLSQQDSYPVKMSMTL